jgi:hypothetical protein
MFDKKHTHKVDLWRTEGVENAKPSYIYSIYRFDMFVSVELTWLIARCVNPIYMRCEPRDEP